MQLPENISPRAKSELEKLLKGNKNFMNGTPTAKNMCLSTLQSLALYQEPYACVLYIRSLGECTSLSVGPNETMSRCGSFS